MTKLIVRIILYENSDFTNTCNVNLHCQTGSEIYLLNQMELVSSPWDPQNIQQIDLFSDLYPLLHAVINKEGFLRCEVRGKYTNKRAETCR